MEHQFRRGIYRPNAQRLSISLEPMVAQRSLMFRVKADLSTKTSYAELIPTDESPMLYTFSAKSTALSSASVYSQDSWKTPSPSVSVFVDPTIAISPAVTVQLSHIEEADSDRGLSTLKSPSVPSVLTTPRDVSFFTVKEEDNDTVSRSKFDDVPSLADKRLRVRKSVRNLVDVGSLRTLGRRLSKVKPQSKKIDDEDSPKHSKSSKAIRKVMNRLTFLPSKRELAQL